MKRIGLLFSLLAMGMFSFAQQATEKVTLNEQNYVQRDGQWFVEVNDQRTYRVDNRIVTVKLKEGYRGFEDIVANGHRGHLMSVAMTGFADILVPSSVDVVDFVKALQLDQAVEIAELNTFGVYSAEPNDPRFGEQWFHNTIQTPQAWDIQTGSPDVIVAVLDSGSEYSHPDFGLGSDIYQNVWLNNEEDEWTSPNNPNTGDGIDNDMNNYIDDWKGWDFASGNNESRGPFNHGSNVAGCISAKTNNGEGISGVAGGWNGEGVKTMICGVGDQGPVGSVLDDAILYAANNGANIVQMSLSVAPSAAIDAALEMAYDNFNILNICAAGNNASSSAYPAINEDVMSISASTESDGLAGFSNRGPLIEVSAPGTNILTMDVGTGYNFTGGTSFSAPITSAIAALVWSENPSLTNEEVRNILKMTAEKVGGFNYNWDPNKPGHSREFGYGRVNAYQAVMAARPQLTYPEALAAWPNNVSVLDLLPLLPLPTN